MATVSIGFSQWAQMWGEKKKNRASTYQSTYQGLEADPQDMLILFTTPTFDLTVRWRYRQQNKDQGRNSKDIPKRNWNRQYVRVSQTSRSRVIWADLWCFRWPAHLVLIIISMHLGLGLEREEPYNSILCNNQSRIAFQCWSLFHFLISKFLYGKA